jgi:AraC-like DNA-binding protein
MRPGYRELAPPPPLRDALACLWVRVAGPEAMPVRILPDACVDIVWQPGRGAWLTGPDTGPALTALAPGTVVLGARFQPGAGGPALRLGLHEVRDARVPFRFVSRDGDRRLRPDLDPATALERLAGLAEGLVGERPPDGAVRAAARALADPRARVETLAAELGYSERHLRRRFDDAIGYGPKTLQRVLRFRRFLAGLDAAGGTGLAGLAAEAGYADQAHLSRECMRLSGLSPAALARERLA